MAIAVKCAAMERIVETLTAELPGDKQAPDWILPVPVGDNTARDGRLIGNREPATVIAAFAADQKDIPVDYEHATEIRSPKGLSAPAVGWIDRLENRDGAILGHVNWTDEGRCQVESRAYRFISPVLYLNSARTVRRISSVALTNDPALYLEPLLRRHISFLDAAKMSARLRQMSCNGTWRHVFEAPLPEMLSIDCSVWCRMRMNLRDYQKSPDDREWELPAWGHPIAQGVMPLFIGVRGRLFPVGTAFTTGKLHFVVTATHNIEEIVKRDPRFEHRIVRERIEGSHDLSDGYALYVLHHRVEGDEVRLTLWPLHKIDGAAPTDVVFASPQYVGQMQTLVSPLSFDIPAVGETLLSVGYSEFSYPDDGIDIEAVKSDRFDWHIAYRHHLFVTEGTVRRIFTKQFASGFVAGPCFAFSPEIRHATSGGPVYNAAGNVCGVNSAAATMYFSEPMSLGSLLYPMLKRPLRFGAEFGPLSLDATRPLLDLISLGSLKTDGSEQHVAFTQDEATGNMIAHPRSLIADREHVHDDFESYQQGKSSSKLTGEYLVLQKREPEQGD